MTRVSLSFWFQKLAPIQEISDNSESNNCGSMQLRKSEIRRFVKLAGSGNGFARFK